MKECWGEEHVEEVMEAPPDDARETIHETDVAVVFNDQALTKPDAVKALMERTGASRASCYRVLKPDGRFPQHLHSTEDGNLRWIQ